MAQAIPSQTRTPSRSVSQRSAAQLDSTFTHAVNHPLPTTCFTNHFLYQPSVTKHFRYQALPFTAHVTKQPRIGDGLTAQARMELTMARQLCYLAACVADEKGFKAARSYISMIKVPPAEMSARFVLG